VKRRALLALAPLGLAACQIYVSLGYYVEVAAGATGGPAGSGGASVTTSTTGTGGTAGAAPCAPVLDAGSPLWSEGYPDPGGGAATSVAVDATGNVVVTGTFVGSIDLGGGPLDGGQGPGLVFIGKLDRNGAYTWSKSLDTGVNGAPAVAVDVAGNVVVTGEFQGSAAFGGGPLMVDGGTGAGVFIAKFTPDGAYAWSRAFPDTGSSSVAVDAAGDVIVAGSASGAADFGGGPLAADGGALLFLAKFDMGGNYLWSKGFANVALAFAGVAGGLAVDAAGNVLLTGSFQSPADFGGGLLTPDGGAGGGLFVAKFSPSGAHLWSRGVSSPLNEAVGLSVSADISANVIVSGQFAGPIDLGCGTLVPQAADLFVGKYDPNGACLWAHGFGGSQQFESAAMGYGVVADPSGNVVVAGGFQGVLDFGSGGVLASAGGLDVFLASLDAAHGSYQWAESFGDPQDQEAAGVAIDACGHVAIVGGFHGTLDFGGNPLMGPGAFVAELAP
jgi:hypothetical protein